MVLQKQKSAPMEGSNVFTLVFRFSIPTIAGLLSTALYNLADAWFVSQLGTDAGAAVGVAFPIQTLMQTVGFTLGLGGGSLLSRKLGEKKEKEAKSYAAIAFWFSLLIGIIIAIAGAVWRLPLVRLLGAEEPVVPLSLAYVKYLLWAAPVMCASFVMGQLLRAKGHVWLSAIGISIGNVFNILLDPIFIFMFDLGIAGASLATLVSHSVGFLLLLLMQGETGGIGRVRGQIFARLGKILYAGFPSLIRQGLTCVAALCVNRIAAAQGVAAVTAMSVVNRLFLLTFSFCAGVGQGMMPVAGYHFGAKRTDKVKRAYSAALLLSAVWMILLSIPLVAYAPQILGFFRRESDVISIGGRALRAHAAVFVLHSVITCTILLLQAIGRQPGALLLACARQGFFFLPLLEWLPANFGGISFIYAQPIADVLTFLLAVPFTVAMLRKRKQGKKQLKN